MFLSHHRHNEKGGGGRRYYHVRYCSIRAPEAKCAQLSTIIVTMLLRMVKWPMAVARSSTSLGSGFTAGATSLWRTALTSRENSIALGEITALEKDNCKI